MLDQWLERPLFDVALSVAVAAVVYAQEWVVGQSADVLLQTLAELAAATAGFGTLTASLLVSVTPSSRLAEALEKVGHRVVRLVIAGLLAMVVGAVAFAVAIGLPEDTGLPAAILAAASLLVVLAIGRSGYILTLVLRSLMPIQEQASSIEPLVVDELPPTGYEPPRRPS